MKRRSLLQRVFALSVSLTIPGVPPAAIFPSASSNSMRSISVRRTEAIVASGTWFHQPLSRDSWRGRRWGHAAELKVHYEHELLFAGQSTDRNFSEHKFSAMVNDSLTALGKTASVYKNAESEPADIFIQYKTLLRKMNVILDLACPGAQFEEEEFWGTVFLEWVALLHREGSTVRLGTVFYLMQRSVILAVAAQYSLPGHFLFSVVRYLDRKNFWSPPVTLRAEEQRMRIVEAVRQEFRTHQDLEVQVGLAVSNRLRASVPFTRARLESLASLLYRRHLSRQLSVFVDQNLQRLRFRSAEIIRKRYAFPPFERIYSDTEIAKEFSTTKGWIWQLEQTALRQLRVRMTGLPRAIHPYVDGLSEVRIKTSVPLERDPATASRWGERSAAQTISTNQFPGQRAFLELFQKQAALYGFTDLRLIDAAEWDEKKELMGVQMTREQTPGGVWQTVPRRLYVYRHALQSLSELYHREVHQNPDTPQTRALLTSLFLVEDSRVRDAAPRMQRLEKRLWRYAHPTLAQRELARRKQVKPRLARQSYKYMSGKYASEEDRLEDLARYLWFVYVFRSRDYPKLIDSDAALRAAVTEVLRAQFSRQGGFTWVPGAFPNRNIPEDLLERMVRLNKTLNPLPSGHRKPAQNSQASLALAKAA